MVKVVMANKGEVLTKEFPSADLAQEFANDNGYTVMRAVNISGKTKNKDKKDVKN